MQVWQKNVGSHTKWLLYNEPLAKWTPSSHWANVWLCCFFHWRLIEKIRFSRQTSYLALKPSTNLSPNSNRRKKLFNTKSYRSHVRIEEWKYFLFSVWNIVRCSCLVTIYFKSKRFIVIYDISNLLTVGIRNLYAIGTTFTHKNTLNSNKITWLCWNRTIYKQSWGDYARWKMIMIILCGVRSVRVKNETGLQKS